MWCFFCWRSTERIAQKSIASVLRLLQAGGSAQVYCSQSW
jgi:hypothetical protein